MSLVLLAVFLVGDEFLLVRVDLALPRLLRCRLGLLRGAHREARKQQLEVGAPAGRTLRRLLILRPDQRLELVAAGAAMKVVDRHGPILIDSFAKRSALQNQT